jgi:hypothetical protein
MENIQISTKLIIISSNECVTNNSLKLYDKKLRPMCNGIINSHKNINEFIIIESQFEEQSLEKNDDIILISIRNGQIKCKVLEVFNNSFKIDKDSNFDYSYTKWIRPKDLGYLEKNMNNTNYIRDNTIVCKLKELNVVKSISLKQFSFNKNIIPIRYFIEGSSKFEYGINNTCLDYFKTDSLKISELKDHRNDFYNINEWTVNKDGIGVDGIGVEISSILTELARKFLLMNIYPDMDIREIFDKQVISNRYEFPFGNGEISWEFPIRIVTNDFDSLQEAIDFLYKNGDLYNLFDKKIPTITDLLNGNAKDIFFPVTIENIRCTTNSNILRTTIKKQNFIEYVENFVKTFSKDPELICKIQDDVIIYNSKFSGIDKDNEYKIHGKNFNIPIYSLNELIITLETGDKKDKPIDIQKMLIPLRNEDSVYLTSKYNFKFVFEIETYEKTQNKEKMIENMLNSRIDNSEKRHSDLTHVKAFNSN